jgi:DnaJ like chaperone protein
MRQYQYRAQPGCGGCFLLLALFLLLAGGTPLLFDFLGFILISGIFMVLLGAAAFWGFTNFIKHKISTYERSQTQAHNDFVYLLVHILVYIAKIDGNITKAELNTINNFFRVNLRYSYDQLCWVKELVKEAQESDTTIEELLTQFKSQFAYEPRLILLELIYQVIYSGQKFVDPEIELAQNIAEFLEISLYDQQTIRSRHVHRQRQAVNSVQQSLEVLGLSEGASPEDIKKAYRQLSMTCHPDKVGHLGEEFKHVAEEKMKELNAAYQFLKTHYM